MKGALAKAGQDAPARSVVAIGIDTTGSTPCAVDRAGTPLALTKGFEENPNAMFVLWKDHTAVERGRAHQHGGARLGRHRFHQVRGRSLLLGMVLVEDPPRAARRTAKVRAAAFSWVEHCDWMPALLTGTH